jgi:6-phosphogluconolactonase (cycloisomerase 2 family)
MSGYLKQVLITAISAAMCICWIACGGRSTPHPCQDATCVPSATEFLYVTALDDVSGFKLGTSGAPTSVQNQSGPNQSIGIVADPSAKFLYVSDFENAGIQAFAINASTGLLTPVVGSPFPAGSAPDPGGIAVDPNTKFLYATLLNSGGVAGFTINPTSGALTAVAGSPFPAGNTPSQAIMDSSGKFLFVSNYNDSLGTISAYSIDPTTGALTSVPGSPFPTQAGSPGPWGLAISGGGKFLSVAMVGTVNANNAISVFSIDPATGVLNQVVGSPFPAGQGPLALASDATGKFLFATNLFGDSLSAFAVDGSSGALTAMAGSPFPTHNVPVAVAVAPDGKSVYVANSASGDLSVYSLNATTGSLSPLSGSPFSAGQQELGGLAIAKTK